MKECCNLIPVKSNNRNAIRVLYKKIGQPPEVKIIGSIYKLKRTIVIKKLNIIPYQNVYIICHNKKQMKSMEKNVILDFSHIAGDFLVLEIDRRKREFKSISQENIVWFTEDLMNRSPVSQDIKPKIDMKSFASYISNGIKRSNSPKSNTSFEHDLINVLNNIQLTLSCLVANNKKGGN